MSPAWLSLFRLVRFPSVAASRTTDVGIQKFRSVEDMPDLVRAKDDPSNLRVTLYLLALGRRLAAAAGTPLPARGITRFRSLAEAQAAEDAWPEPRDKA